MTITNRGT
ncbi:hypothetical protein D039_4645A, partial [Vibrio parahaemolyticus EKP-028]